MVGWMNARGSYDAYMPMVNGLKTSVIEYLGRYLNVRSDAYVACCGRFCAAPGNRTSNSNMQMPGDNRCPGLVDFYGNYLVETVM